MGIIPEFKSKGGKKDMNNNTTTATNNTANNTKEEMNMMNNTNLISADGSSFDSIIKVNAYFNILSVDDIKKIAKELGIIEVARLRNKERIISIITKVMVSRKETRKFIERQAYRRVLEVQANAIDSVKMGIANKEEKEMTAEEKLAAMNPGFINATVNGASNKEEVSGYPVNPLDDSEIQKMDVSDDILLKPIEESEKAAEVTVPVGDLEITSDKMVVAEEKKEKKQMDKKEYNKQLCIGAIVYAWMQKSSAKNKRPLFFTATSKGDFYGNKISSRKYVFAATCEAVEAVFSCKKLGTERYQQVRDWLVEAGYCHLYNGVDIHMTTQEWNKCVQLTQLIYTKAKEHNCKTVIEYINSRKR